MSEGEPKLLLEEILEGAEKIVGYTQSLTFDEFIADRKTADAVVRNFGIIGETASRLTGEFREANAEIDWLKITGLKSRIVHDDFGVDYSIIWSLKKNYLPGLIHQIMELLNNH